MREEVILCSSVLYHVSVAKVTERNTYFIHRPKLMYVCMCLCVCAPLQSHVISVYLSMIQSILTLVNPFAIELTTAITVSTSVVRSLSLFSTSPHPNLHSSMSSHTPRGPTHIGVPLPTPEWVSPSSSRHQGHVSPHPHSSGWDMPLDKCVARPWPSNQWRPSLLRRLIQYLKQQVTEGLGHGAVTCRRQVEEVKHVLWDDGSVGVDKLSAQVQ